MRLLISLIVLGFMVTGIAIGAESVRPEAGKTPSFNPVYGTFNLYPAPLEIRYDPTGVKTRAVLIQNFTFTDNSHIQWTVQKDFESDGASIPKVFWSIVGGPFDYSYLNAAVIHDWYCVKKSRPWKKVHRMFYDACLASNVEDREAKVLYAAVRYFGPRWDSEGNPLIARCVSRASAEKVARWVRKHNPSLREIDNLKSVKELS